MSAIRDYLSEVQNEFNTGIAGEHAYRPALKTLLESLEAVGSAVNDPARDDKIGMPDFVVLRQPGNVPIGIVEAKDIGNQLSRSEKSAQIKRYMKFGSLLLTNYLEFRWYVDGEKRETVRIARVRKGKIVRISSAYKDLDALLRRFSEQEPANINSAQVLAQRLARNTQLIAHFIVKDLKSSDPSPNLENQMAAFANTLIPDLDVVKFADMYAQTLAYGLFAARVNYPGDPAQFSLGGAAEYIPRTNPFLRRLFYFNSFDLGRRLTWLVESLVTVLRHTDMDSILEHFGRRTGQTDPVVHFYETFLNAYDPELQERRGVYYTPEPVVKYIVRSVDHILKTRFDRPAGLADKDTLILDPAAGTGTFLYHVIEQIKARFIGQRGLWKDYVEERLLPRIFGFELLMAPYTIAHMNLGLQLKEAGYEFKEGERLGIYLTNALEEAVEAPPLPFANFIAEEANKAAEVKRDKPIMVVLGNPPYSGHSANKGEWIGKLVRDYYFVDGKPLGERLTKWLQDDYVKFIRFGQWRIEQTGEGILAFITNHGYLDNPTFRGMRQQLLQTFSEIYILNLHGNSIKREQTPDGNVDENVFDIRPGVAIAIFVKHSCQKDNVATVMYRDIWGTRRNKYAKLNDATLAASEWQELTVSKPYLSFTPIDLATTNEYGSMPSIKEIIPDNSLGIFTARDSLTIHNTPEALWKTVSHFTNLEAEEAREYYNLGPDGSGWRVHWAQADIEDNGLKRESIVAITYRPFDTRYTYYTGRSNGFHCRPRRQIMSNFLETDNDDYLGFAIGRAGQAADFNDWNVVYCTDKLLDQNVFRRGGGALFPLYLYPSKQHELTDTTEYPLSERGRRPNLSKAFVAEMETRLGLPFQTEGSAFLTPPPAPPQSIGEGSVDKSAASTARQSSPHRHGGTAGGERTEADWFGPDDVFYYAYAIFHSPTYRERYAEFLKIDFPRLPLTSDIVLFAALVQYGAELVSLHLMKSPALANLMTTFDVDGDGEVVKAHPKYVEKGGRVYINKRQYFGGVPREVWDFHIGGYQVLDKWLKDRKGRQLSLDDKEHYQKIVVALSETIRIMSAIDAAIPQFPLE